MAGHGKVWPTGFLFHRRRRKTTNLIDNEIHVTTETIFISKHFAILRFCDSGKDCNFQAFCDPGKKHSAILARRGNRRKVAHFRRHLFVVY